MSGSAKGITADRKSVEKLSFIIENHSTLTRQELADKLNESPRWIKRQVSILKKKGFLENKREVAEEIVWPEEMTKVAIDLRVNKLMYAEEISKILKEQYSFEVPSYVVEYHLINRLDCKFPSKEEWLYNHLPYDYAKKLIEEGNRISDISAILKKDLGVYISDDIILIYIKKIGLVSLREYQVNKVSEKFDSIDKDWLDSKIESKISMRKLCEEIGISKTVVKRKFKEENLEIIDDRKIWSKNLEFLRDYLISLPKPNFTLSEEDFHQCLLGWIAGDGSINTDGRFVVTHSVMQLSYLYLKRQVLFNSFSNVVASPSNHFAMSKDGNKMYFGGKEQIGISCLGFKEYVKYLNEDGSKNLEKIFSELTDLGWACYYMDDGSYFGDLTISMSEKLAELFENRYRFKNFIKNNKYTLRVDPVDPKYLIPCMYDKLPDSPEVGSFWKHYLPELFDVKVENDFDLCLINKYVTERSEDLMDRTVEYYQKRGFPYFSINDDYLKKEYDNLVRFDSSFLWKTDNTIRHLDLGNRIFKNFMPHLTEIEHESTTPQAIFNDPLKLKDTIEYTLNKNKTILPDFIFDSLVSFNGEVSFFPCSVAKAIVEKYSKVGDTIVDPNAEWGGRLLGTVSASRYYCGFESDFKTSDGLFNIIEYYGLDNNAYLLDIDFYDLRVAPVSCDLIMTSTPLSIDKFTGMERWIDFLKKVFEYTERSLKVDGYLILELPDKIKKLLPKFKFLIEKESIYWFTISKRKSLDFSKTLSVWQKI